MGLSFAEGDVFAIPVENGGSATGIIMRRPSRRGHIVLVYVYAELTPQAATNPPIAEPALICRVSDLALRSGTWKIVGHVDIAGRRDPDDLTFRRHNYLGGADTAVTYDNSNLVTVLSEGTSPAELSRAKFVDSLFGAKALEIWCKAELPLGID